MIYFMQAGSDGNIKIGFTAGTVEHRRAQLQVGCPEQLRVIATIDGGVEMEAAIHEQFARYRVHGEWFRPVPEVIHYPIVHKNELELARFKANPRFIKRDEFNSDCLVSDQLGPSYHLICPVCGFDYNHRGETEPLLGWENRKDLPEGHELKKSRSTGLRGDGLSITFRGECGHTWRLCTGFHKGYSFLFATFDPTEPENLSSEDPDDIDDLEFPPN